IDIAEFIIDDRARGTGMLARRGDAVLADVAHHQPAAGAGTTEQRIEGHSLAFRGELLDELDVPPGGGGERSRVVVALAGPSELLRGEEVPLLAGDLAGLAADADRGVGVEAHLRSWGGRFDPAERADEALQDRREPGSGRGVRDWLGLLSWFKG